MGSGMGAGMRRAGAPTYLSIWETLTGFGRSVRLWSLGHDGLRPDHVKGVDMSVRFNAPPGWPLPSESWTPGDDWMPDPSWPLPPHGWAFWAVVDRAAKPTAYAALAGVDGADYGTDRGRWIAGLRARAATAGLAPDATASARTGAEATAPRATTDSSWELDGLLTSVGRVDL